MVRSCAVGLWSRKLHRCRGILSHGDLNIEGKKVVWAPCLREFKTWISFCELPKYDCCVTFDDIPNISKYTSICIRLHHIMASWPLRLWHTVMVGCMVSLQLVSTEGVESTALYSAHCGPETNGSTAKLRFLMDCDGCCPSNLMNRKKCHPNSTVQFHSRWNAMISWDSWDIDSILLLDREPWQKIEEFDEVWVCQDMPSQTHQSSNLQTRTCCYSPASQGSHRWRHWCRLWWSRNRNLFSGAST